MNVLCREVMCYHFMCCSYLFAHKASTTLYGTKSYSCPFGDTFCITRCRYDHITSIVQSPITRGLGKQD